MEPAIRTYDSDVDERWAEARRTIKPEISLIGEHGLEIRDELELEMTVGP